MRLQRCVVLNWGGRVQAALERHSFALEPAATFLLDWIAAGKPGTYQPTRSLRHVRYCHSVWAYAVSAYALARPCPVLPYRMGLRASYGMSSTAVASQ
eukprot:912352-Rhodomonas_salina.1